MQRRSKMGEESRSCRANVADRGVFRILINPRRGVVTTKHVNPASLIRPTVHRERMCTI